MKWLKWLYGSHKARRVGGPASPAWFQSLLLDNLAPVDIAPIVDLAPAVEIPRDPSERERPERKPEVPQCDVVVAVSQNQVRDDAPEPERHDVAEDPRLQHDAEGRDDLHDSDREHELVAVPLDQPCHERAQVLVPVHQLVKELV